jgi:CRP/FNR family transcriptional regulator, anaerobic regulatory protein
MNLIWLYQQDAVYPQAQVCGACEVRQSALFGALDNESLHRIHAHIADTPMAPDSSIYNQGERGASVFTIRSGIVRFERVTAGGARRIVRLAGRGDLIGQEALLGRAYGDDAVACTPVQLCRIPRGLVEDLGEHQVALLRELMQRWQRALDDAQEWIADLAMGTARRRMLRLLVKLAEHADTTDTIWLPRREELAVMLDMALETASRLISQLRREGILELLGQRSARLNLTALQEAVRLQDAG